MIYQLIEIEIPEPNQRGYTYDVTHSGEVLVCSSYTRHIHLARAANREPEEIAWGGVMTPEGQWVRGSLDFGDAPNEESRQKVLNMICHFYNLRPKEDIW